MCPLFFLYHLFFTELLVLPNFLKNCRHEEENVSSDFWGERTDVNRKLLMTPLSDDTNAFPFEINRGSNEEPLWRHNLNACANFEHQLQLAVKFDPFDKFADQSVYWIHTRYTWLYTAPIYSHAFNSTQKFSSQLRIKGCSKSLSQNGRIDVQRIICRLDIY